MSGSSPANRFNRREARERAVELAYEAESRSCTTSELIDTLLVNPEPFAVELLLAVDTHREQADKLITGRSKGWTLERMPMIDRLVMRLAIAEMLASDTPTGVVLSEAVDLAGRYSTDESSRFVNGVLASIAREIRPNDLPN